MKIMTLEKCGTVITTRELYSIEDLIISPGLANILYMLGSTCTWYTKLHSQYPQIKEYGRNNYVAFLFS